MSVIHDGSLVVLSSVDSIFIVRVPADLWAFKADGNVPLNHYICGVQEVHPTLFESPRSPKLLRARWIESNYMKSSVQLLAALFDDNRIRIYQADDICDVPSLMIDYNSLMCAADRTYQGCGSNSYGFFKSIASFDCVVLRDECPIVVAIDSEGEIYTTSVNIDSSLLPWTHPLVSPSSLPCDPIDIRVVNHPMSDVFSIFAILSVEGVISFLIAVPDDRSNYSLFLHEQLQLPEGNTWNLSASDFEFTVLAACDTSVLHIDLFPSLHKYLLAFEGPSSDINHSSVLENSLIHELISLPDYSTGTLPGFCCSEDPVLSLICRSTNPNETTTLFITCSKDPPLFTAFLKQQLRDYQWTDNISGIQSTLNDKVMETILSNRQHLPHLRFASSQERFLEDIILFFETANKNQLVLRAALDMNHDRLAELVKSVGELTRKQNAINHRLMEVLRQIAVIKERMQETRLSVTNIFIRIDKICAHLADTHELTADEKKLLNTLKEYRSKVLTNAIITSKLSLEAAELQRETKGPAKAFTASAGANMFVLKHSEQELTGLNRRLDILHAKLQECDLIRAEENKENMQRLC
ncbi:hypothetical protein DICVIV_06254 [Dictyocaulus viviparus]|uniref:Nucleoporin Nup88 n=1 Tax=Dictyocaulus viviparus TaxID=29172 RepID=A0A0D8XV32_DICVI|nr:hypothetical protein DICVIV_06254 [Dictyocaulus viviparus]